MWAYLQDYCHTTSAPIVLGTLTVLLALTKLTGPMAQLACSSFLSVAIVSSHGHSDLPIIMLSLITGTIMIGTLHGTSSKVTSNVVLSTKTVVFLIVAALLIVNEPIAGIAVYADATTQADAGYAHYKGYLLVTLIALGALELSSVSLGTSNSGRPLGIASLLCTTDFLLVALATGLALAPTAARTLVSKVDSDSSNPTSQTVRESSYACGMNANSPNAATSPSTSVMNVTYTLCFVYAEILILALISAYSQEHSGLPMSPTYLLLLGLTVIIANAAGDYRQAMASSSAAQTVTLPAGFPSTAVTVSSKDGSRDNKASKGSNGNKASKGSNGNGHTASKQGSSNKERSDLYQREQQRASNISVTSGRVGVTDGSTRPHTDYYASHYADLARSLLSPRSLPSLVSLAHDRSLAPSLVNRSL